MSMRVVLVSTSAEQRRRLSRGSVLLHVWQWQPIVGTPHEVPVPKNVIFISYNVYFRLDGDAEALLHIVLYGTAEGNNICTGGTSAVHQH